MSEVTVEELANLMFSSDDELFDSMDLNSMHKLAAVIF